MKILKIVTLFSFIVLFFIYCTKTDQVVVSTTAKNTTDLFALKTTTAPTIDGAVDAVWARDMPTLWNALKRLMIPLYLQNAKIAGTGLAVFGNNGFANSIETATESGLYSGTYLYSRATDPTIKACLDSDYDGVADIDDLDDDNDGILDANECSVALMIENNPANLGQVSRKSWTFNVISEQDVNSFAGATFGALRAEATQNVYGEVKLPPATTPVINPPLEKVNKALYIK